jgi:hypothetical protein
MAVVLCCALVGGSGAAYGAVGQEASTPGYAVVGPEVPASDPTPSPTTSQEKQKFAKTRFVLNAGLAAGATYEWIYKPFKEGKFRKGAHGRTGTLIKAGLAAAFTYNRLKAAVHNAQGDPLLSRAIAPLQNGIESLKDLPSKLRRGETPEDIAQHFNGVIGGVKDAGKSAGVDVKNQVPSFSQLTGG